MNDTFEQIKAGIRQLFTEAGDVMLSEDTALEDLPDWDSMAAVNLQSYIEQEFGIAVGLDRLDEETTLGELVDHIETLQSASVTP
jgi:acyl carrier protein